MCQHIDCSIPSKELHRQEMSCIEGDMLQCLPLLMKEKLVLKLHECLPLKALDLTLIARPHN
jgi:hypothetical protein